MLSLLQYLSWSTRSLWGLDVGVFGAARCLAERQRQRRRSAREENPSLTDAQRAGRLLARPGQPTGKAPLGLRPLGLASPCDGLLYVPPGYRPDRPAPFLLILHGATGVGLFALWPIILFANSHDLIILAPDSRGRTWDRVHGTFGPDVAFVDQALEFVFSRYAVDPERLGIGGFSDGASYALSLGLTNGDLFKKVIAFSPGFMAPGEQVGRPPVFISHGVDDIVLPVSCSQRLVPRLRAEGYDVTYAEFAGGHVVPVGIAGQAVERLAAYKRVLGAGG